MTNQPGYRIQWRANKTGTWAHAVVTDVHEWVVTAITEDPNGGPYSIEELDRMLADCQSRNRLVRREREGDKRCAYCMHIVGTLDAGIEAARRNWAIGKLDSAIDVLTEVAPVGVPEHVTPG